MFKTSFSIDWLYMFYLYINLVALQSMHYYKANVDLLTRILVLYRTYVIIRMKSFLVICFLAVATLASARPSDDHYTDRYDNIDVQEILGNRRLLLPYIKCILDQGKCTPEGKELKSHIKEALETECVKCTEVQRKETRRVIGHLINHEADHWKQLVDKYDPDHKFSTKYEKELKSVSA